MKPYTDAQGILDQRTTTLQKTLSNVDTQKADLAKRLAALQEKLTTQFNLLSAMRDEMTKRQKSITDNLASLPYGSGKNPDPLAGGAAQGRIAGKTPPTVKLPRSLPITWS